MRNSYSDDQAAFFGLVVAGCQRVELYNIVRAGLQVGPRICTSPVFGGQICGGFQVAVSLLDPVQVQPKDTFAFGEALG